MREVKELGRLPVVNFAAGGIATPADAALMMQLGADGVFVGSGIFKVGEPARHGEGDRPGDDALPRPEDPRRRVAGLGSAMRGRSVASMPESELLSTRGW